MRKEQLTILIVVCLGCFFYIQSIGSINVSLPAIQKEFGVSLAAVQWIGLMGTVMLSSLSLCFGRTGDIFGRKKMFEIGLALYSLGAGLATLSASFPQLLFFRCVMAVGLAMAVPIAAALIASTQPHESRGQALGLLASSMAIGRMTGPTIGGFILFFWGWRAVFLTNCLFGVVLCLTLFWVLKGKEERLEGTLDFWSVAFLTIGFPSVLIALSLGPISGWGSPQISLWFGLGAAGLVGFVWRELRSSAPLMKLSYFKNVSLSAAIVSLTMSSAVQYPISIFGPLYMQNVLHASALAVGLVMATLPFCTAIFSPLSGRLGDRFNARWVAALGLCFILLGLFFYSRLGINSPNIRLVSALAVFGVGIGLFTPANQKLAFSFVHSEDYGILSAMLTSFGTASGTLGATVAVALAEASRKDRAIQDAVGFAYDQQFAFSLLLPVAAVAVVITLLGRSDPRVKNGSVAFLKRAPARDLKRPDEN